MRAAAAGVNKSNLSRSASGGAMDDGRRKWRPMMQISRHVQQNLGAGLGGYHDGMILITNRAALQAEWTWVPFDGAEEAERLNTIQQEKAAAEAVKQEQIESMLNEELAPGSQIHVRGIGRHGWDGTPVGVGEFESEAKLRALFGFAGQIVGVHIRHRISHASADNTSWAVITFATQAMAERALDKARGSAGDNQGIMAGTEPLEVTLFDSKRAAQSKGGMATVRQEVVERVEEVNTYL